MGHGRGWGRDRRTLGCAEAHLSDDEAVAKMGHGEPGLPAAGAGGSFEGAAEV